jgi:aminomethyltransferase
VGRQEIGVVTSGTLSPVLNETIALARVAVQFRELGTKVEVGKLDGLQKRIGATVARFPFYDPEKTRPRS